MKRIISVFLSVIMLISAISVPASAAVNEAVKLTQKKGFYNIKGFVNGILRSVIRGS